MISTTPRKAGTAPGGNCATAATSIFSPPTSMMRVIGTPSRSTLSIRPMNTAPEARADHPAAPAEDRRAADHHRGDGDEFGADAVGRIGVLALRDVHQARDDGAQRGQDVGAHAHEARVDAGVARRLLVAAGGVGRPADRRVGERHGGDRRDHQENDDLVVEAQRVVLAEPEEVAESLRLDLERDVLAAGQAEDARRGR